MKCENKRLWILSIKKALVLYFLTFCTYCGFAKHHPQEVTCPVVTSITILEKDSSSVKFKWEATSEVDSFKIWFCRIEDGYTSPEEITTNQVINFTNLPVGTYRFYFVSICGGATSSFIIVDDLIMG